MIFFIESIYKSIGIDTFMEKYSKANKCKFDINEFKDELQYHMHKNICKHYGRDCTLVFYDATNYYFEIDEETDFKKNGMSKENKRSPIVQMGLFIDSNGIPIAYKLFPGNTHDASTLIPILTQMKKEFNLNRIIITADKGLNCGTNLGFISENKDGYIVSQKVRGAKKEFIEKVLDPSDYIYIESGKFKCKSFIRERICKDAAGKEISLKEKVICFWSKNYEDRERHKRDDIDEKINSFIENPTKYNASNSYGIKKYLKQKNLNTETGEIEKINPILEFNQEKYERDKSLDGYYCLITSEIDLEPMEVIEKYRGLWKIEESFKVLKSDLEGRPVYVRREDRIEGHFMICFIALTIMRILELHTKHKFSIAKLQEALLSVTVSNKGQSIYEISNKNEVYKEIEKSFGVEQSLDNDYCYISKIKSYKKEICTYKK